MAERNFWTIVDGKVAKGLIHFRWEPGTPISQRRNSCVNMHEALDFHCDLKSLDISSASTENFGVALSAFNLTWRGRTVECWYQGSKVYSVAGPMHSLYNATSMEAKQSMKNPGLGTLIGFNLEGIEYPMIPKTVFYDYIYLCGMYENYGDKLDLSMYDCFTDVQATVDIDACQARSVCLYKLLQMRNMFYLLDNFDQFRDWHQSVVECPYTFEYFQGWLREVDDTTVKCLGDNLNMLLSSCRFCNMELEHMEYSTYRLLKSVKKMKIDKEYCVVYSDLLLDDLCALEALSRKYSKIYLVAVNPGDLITSLYASSRVRNLIEAEAVLKKWFKEVVLRINCISKDGHLVTYPDCYSLANATKIAEDIKSPRIQFSKIIGMIGSDTEARKDDEEWNASQDPDAYVDLCHAVGFNQVTADYCRYLYKEYGYYTGDYGFLEEYIRKMNAINDEVCCFDLQAVMS